MPPVLGRLSSRALPARRGPRNPFFSAWLSPRSSRRKTRRSVEVRVEAVRFEHLVEVNDLKDPCGVRVTRAQLWRGLVLRAEQPTSFVPQLSEATILARTESGLARALRYGAITVTDEVSFVHLERVRYEIAAQAELSSSSLTMHIEELQPGALFVRFTYEDDAGEDDAGAEDAMLDSLRRAAYEDADVDTVGTIRWLAAAGRLDEP